MVMTTEAKVGGVTIAGFLLFAYMVMHLGGFTFGDRGYPIEGVFTNVAGLKQGNAVRYAGVEVGRVTSVHITPDGIQATMLIHPDVKVPEGSKFVIGTDGLVGEKYIEIIPPRNIAGYLSPHAVVRGEDPHGMEQLIGSADKVLADIQTLVRSMNDIMGDEKFKASIKDTMLNAREMAANLNAMSAVLARMAQSSEGDVNAMVGNLKTMSEHLRLVAARVDKMAAGVDNNGQTVKDLREMIASLKATSVKVEKMAASLEGVVTDPATSKNIKETLQNAHDAAEKANRMLTKVESVSVKPGFEILYNPDSGKYRSNADVRITTSPRDFAILGISSIGDNVKTNLQFGRGNEQFSTRAGVMDSKAGVGFDTRLGQGVKFSVDLYDPNQFRVKLRTQIQLMPDTFLIGQMDSVNRDARKNNYLGLQRSF